MAFVESAEVLHYRHLGKQRVETKQIFNALTLGKGWIHHPATKMWAGHEYQLLEYGKAMCLEWIKRGYKDSLLSWFEEQQQELTDSGMPPWLGDDVFHESHRSKLMGKKPDFYCFENTRLGLPYQWPTLTKSGYILVQGK